MSVDYSSRTPSSTLDLNASESGDDADRAPTRILCATLFVNRPKPRHSAIASSWVAVAQPRHGRVDLSQLGHDIERR